MSDELFDAGLNVTTWSHAVETDINGDSEFRVRGPVRYDDWNDDEPDADEIYIRIGGTVDDIHHDSAGADVTLSFDVETAERLATVLGEVAQADVEQFGEVVDDE